MTRHPWIARMPSTLIAFALLFAGCGSTASANQPTLPSTTPQPPATATVVPGATATFGPPCSGTLWLSPITQAGPDIPLPPQTVSGLLETSPNVNGWVGHYQRLCSSGNLDYVDAFILQQMPAKGWSYGPPSGGCLCDGLPVWSRPNDARLVQFDAHPYQVLGTVQWGVTIFTH